MRTPQLVAVALSALLAQNGVSAKEMVPDAATSALYDSGVIHERLMAKKHATWDRQRASGAMNSSQYQSYRQPGAGEFSAQAFVPCTNGVATVVAGNAMQTFKCKNIDYYDFVSHANLGSRTGEGSSSWGWTSPTGREFVVIAQADGAAFAEITSAGKLVYLGRLPQASGAATSIWREIRGYKNYIVIGSEAVNHGIQVFDMSKLLTANPASPTTYSVTADVTSVWNGLPNGRTHNVVINEEKNYAVAVGAQPRTSTCRSGLIFIDLVDPKNPKTLGCAAGDGYVHDAQCLVYRGPDTRYVGRDICYGYNEDTLTIYDVTNKNSTTIISRTSYTGASYTHQGWVTDPMNQQFLVLDDELDEENRVGPAAQGRPITYFWDIRTLTAPRQTGYFRSSATGIDHNQFVVDGFTYQSNYGSGLRVLDLRSLPTTPTGASVTEAAFFDVYPEDDAQGGVVDFVGTWSHYPFFKSGYILVNTIERGAFVLKRTT
ncbi:hypothetical protein B0T17DRAFT_658868 [Bombardia bombarda]|uniref:Regulatory P domain-containing protein n=1 Tax=Bombardia bombarda TaxID=252184 RepID=A0AA39U2H8_9PEZI|nr:hypothetical protein B0T17DRAFT_658868 [Bombardia bombarda]